MNQFWVQVFMMIKIDHLKICEFLWYYGVEIYISWFFIYVQFGFYPKWKFIKIYMSDGFLTEKLYKGSLVHFDMLYITSHLFLVYNV